MISSPRLASRSRSVGTEPRARPCSDCDRQAREQPLRRRLGDDERRPRGRASASPPRGRRTGSARRRAAPGRRARAAPAPSTASGPPQRPRSGSAAKNASPGRAGSTAAPIPSSRRSDRSQAASARSGSAGTRTSAGQRDERLAEPHPGADPEAPPRRPRPRRPPVAPPGSGASATGRPSSSRRSPSALRSCEAGDQDAGDREFTGESNTCSYRAQGCQARIAVERQN